MTEQLSVAVIGAGMAGRSHANGYREANTIHGGGLPKIRLAAIADVNLELAREVADRYGFEKALGSWQEVADDPTIDVVSVVVGNSLHREVVEALLAAGKHVLCEKPLAASLEDAEAMVAAAEKATTIAATAYSFRRNPAIEAIRERLADGALGKPAIIEAHYMADYACDPEAPMGWRFRGPLGSGALADLGAHIVDLAREEAGLIARMRRSMARLGLDSRRLSFALGRGSPVAATLRQARASGADLVVATTQRRSRVGAAMLGSIGGLLRGARCDMLIVPGRVRDPRPSAWALPMAGRQRESCASRV